MTKRSTRPQKQAGKAVAAQRAELMDIKKKVRRRVSDGTLKVKAGGEQQIVAREMQIEIAKLETRVARSAASSHHSHNASVRLTRRMDRLKRKAGV